MGTDCMIDMFRNRPAFAEMTELGNKSNISSAVPAGCHSAK